MVTRPDRSRLPAPGASRSFSFPPVRKSALSNGMRVWTVRQAEIPIVAFVLLVSRGAAADPAGQDGLAATTADMLDEGSGDRSAIEMHEAIGRLGTQFDTDIGADAMTVSATVLSRLADRALALLGDVVARPALREADFARVRDLRLHRLVQLRDMPAAVADRAFLKLLYGGDPYGHAPIGSEAALAGLQVGDARGFHARLIRPSTATLIAVGDCDHDDIARRAGDAFDGWIGTAEDETPEVGELPAAPHLAIVPRSGAAQSELRIGQVSAPRSTPDYHALVVANTILGGQFVSRLNINLREDKGFTYGARTAFEFRRRRGPFVLQTAVQTSGTVQAIEESIGEIDGMRGPRPVSSDELDLAVAALTRGYARNFETSEQIARAVLQLALHDLPDDYYAQFVPTVERITSDDVAQVMARHTDPGTLTTVIVGDPDAIGQELGRLGLGDPVILPASPALSTLSTSSPEAF